MACWAELSTENWAGSFQCFGGVAANKPNLQELSLLCLMRKRYYVALQNGRADIKVDFWFYMDISLWQPDRMSHNGRMFCFVFFFYEVLACNKSDWDSAKSYALFYIEDI